MAHAQAPATHGRRTAALGAGEAVSRVGGGFRMPSQTGGGGRCQSPGWRRTLAGLTGVTRPLCTGRGGGLWLSLRLTPHSPGMGIIRVVRRRAIEVGHFAAPPPGDGCGRRPLDGLDAGVEAP